MSDHPLTVFTVVLSSLTVIVCSAAMLYVVTRWTVTRPLGKGFACLFFAAMGLLALDEMISVLFDEPTSEHLTNLPWHMLVLRLLVALGLAGVAIGMNLDADRWRRRRRDESTPAERELAERKMRDEDLL